jgi:hypothetical protein
MPGVMNLRRSLFLFLLFSLLSGCALDDSSGIQVYSSSFYFSESQHGWSGGFTDYKTTDSLDSELYFGYDYLPENLATNKKSLKLSGKNIGDKLSMFVKKKITGLSPYAEYTLVYEVTFASNAQVGVASGDDVKLVTGAFTYEPIVEEVDGYYRLSLANTSYSPDNFAEIGTIGNTNSEGYDYVVKGNATSAYPYIIGRANSNGEIWLYVGTNSSYKDVTTIYFTYINVVFSRSN